MDKYYETLQNYILATEFDEIDTSFASIIFLTKTYTYGEYDYMKIQIALFSDGDISVTRFISHGKAYGVCRKRSFPREVIYYI